MAGQGLDASYLKEAPARPWPVSTITGNPGKPAEQSPGGKELAGTGHLACVGSMPRLGTLT